MSVGHKEERQLGEAEIQIVISTHTEKKSAFKGALIDHPCAENLFVWVFYDQEKKR